MIFNIAMNEKEADFCIVAKEQCEKINPANPQIRTDTFVQKQK
jgi:hypothetical protein